MNQHAEIVGMNLIFVDELGGRIHAWIAAQNINQLENLLIEGETYNVHTFVVRQYGAMVKERCFENDIYIQLYHMTEIFMTGGVDFIPRHVFKFSELSSIMVATTEANFLIDVVGIVQQVEPIKNFKNRFNQQKTSIRFTINDMIGSVDVIFYNEIAQSFDQGLHDANHHPVIVIISSCKPQLHEDEIILTNKPATRFFINHNHQAVEELRDALRLAEWHLNN